MQNTNLPDTPTSFRRSTMPSDGLAVPDDLLHTIQGGTRDPSAKHRRRCMCVVAIVLLAAGGGVAAYVVREKMQSGGRGNGKCAPATATLVQSIPVGEFSIKRVDDALPTHEAFIQLADFASTSLDFTAMYMALTGTEDRKHWDAKDMKRFGAGRGEAVFHSLVAAAKRGVAIRVLLGTLQDPMNSTEVRELLKHDNVQARTWEPKKWYDGGIMHLKLWNADGAAAYIGSANADWKSLAQVKELGLLLNGTAAVADLGRIFDVFWAWAAPSVPPHRTRVYSSEFQAELTVPAWDPTVPAGLRSDNLSPFALGRGGPLAALSSAADQQLLCLAFPGDRLVERVGWNGKRLFAAAEEEMGSGGSGGGGGDGNGSAVSEAFVSASPGGALTLGRTPDLDALLLTIRSAERRLALSVMDFLPASGYSGGHGNGPVWWPTLVDAILAVAYAKPVHVRILVSRWAHTSSAQGPAMRRLADGMAACQDAYTRCLGRLEVRQYQVPGWEVTDGTHLPANTTAKWPAFTRVNHAKYIVSDARVNIGTSNWEWGYFHQTAGKGRLRDGGRR